MARMTKEQAAKEAALQRRRVARARRHEARREAEAEAIKIHAVSEESDGKVDATALGVKQQSIAASESPKVVKKAREQLAEAFIAIGDVKALTAWGKKNPTEFYRIWARMITPEKEDGNTTMPLETLLAELAKRGDQPIDQAASAIGAEALARARDDVNVEDAVAAFNRGETAGRA